MSTFPTARPSYLGFTSGHTLSVDQHASQHNAEQADISALSDKLGLGASTPVANTVLIGSGVGTSSWSQVSLTTMVSGVLPVANGGTGTTSSTGTGSVVLATAPTLTNPILVTPTITDFTNAPHSHANTGQGTQLGTSAFPVKGVDNDRLNYPYIFSVWRNAAFTPNSAAVTPIPYDSKLYDTGGNVDLVSNKGRFTAPIKGYYAFKAVGIYTLTANDHWYIGLQKNGIEIQRFAELTAPATSNLTIGGAGELLLLAGDYIEVYIAFSATARPAVTGDPAYQWFTGHLIAPA